MNSKLLVITILLVLAAAASAQPAPVQPRITGISHLAVYSSDLAAADHYYREIIGAVKLPDPEDPHGVRYAINSTQFIEVLPLPPGQGINRLDHIGYNTSDAEGMRKYLAAKAWKTPAKVDKGADGSRWFSVLDPEGNKVEFVEPPRLPMEINAPSLIGRHIIHLGIMVHSRAVEDSFYKDLLGFRPYWFGGMVANRIDWVSQQTPDSQDWMEYMLAHDTASSGIPANITQHDLGILDHLSIGVRSVEAAHKTLEEGNRLNGVHDAHTQIGKDGKGQFNLYDPDGIRLELMDFHATEKPCCSPFTATDPEE
ncbi:MAG TPA: VOC family protein [Terracidiphilus sp.]|jgi:catechol 2,3-dioxygenase-like lactoylglutathione lyase family enzyme